MFYISLYLFIAIGCESSVIRVSNDDLNINFGRIMDKHFLKSIRQLTNQFPDKVIELQVEYSNSPVKMPLYGEKPKRLRLGNNNIKRSKNVRREGLPVAITTTQNPFTTTAQYLTTTVYTVENHTTTPTESTTEITTMTDPATTSSVKITRDSQANPEKVPVYLDDLKRAFAEFEQKQLLHKDCNNIPTDSPTTIQPLAVHNPSTASGKLNRRIQDILQVIGKGIKVQYNVPEPKDNNLDWIKIKVRNEK